MSRPAAFLDRDGTLNVRPAEHRWITSPREFTWIPGAPEATSALARAGYLLAIVSNQRGIARGVVSPATLCAVETLIQGTLAEHDCEIAAFAYCPHEPEANCDCRKPRAGMIITLARKLDVDLERSWVIGDSATDVLAGQAAGCRTALVGGPTDGCTPDISAPSLEAVTRLVLHEDRVVHPPEAIRPASNSATSAW